MTIETKQENFMARYFFNDDEKRDLGAEMAQASIESDGLEEELKSVKAQYKANVEQAQLTRNVAARKIKDGYEMQRLECKMEYDYVRRTRTVFHPQSGEVVQVFNLSADECQGKLFIDEAEEGGGDEN